MNPVHIQVKLFERSVIFLHLILINHGNNNVHQVSSERIFNLLKICRIVEQRRICTFLLELEKAHR